MPQFDPMAYGPPPGAAPDPSMGYTPDMAGAPPDPSMAGGDEFVPPIPEELLGGQPPPDTTSTLLWVPLDPGVPIDDRSCGAIGGIAVVNADGQMACAASPGGEPGPLPPGFMAANEAGMTPPAPDMDEVPPMPESGPPMGPEMGMVARTLPQ